MQNLPADLAHPPGSTDKGNDLTQTNQLADVERAHVVGVMRRERGNKARAARALAVDRRTLYRLLEKYHVGTEEIGGSPT